MFEDKLVDRQKKEKRTEKKKEKDVEGRVIYFLKRKSYF